MTKVSISPNSGDGGFAFQADSGSHLGQGDTPGEALDAVTAQLSAEQRQTVVVVQSFAPDALFTASQRDRLCTLMQKWRDARAAGTTLALSEQRELEDLTAAELQAATRRADELADELGK